MITGLLDCDVRGDLGKIRVRINSGYGGQMELRNQIHFLKHAVQTIQGTRSRSKKPFRKAGSLKWLCNRSSSAAGMPPTRSSLNCKTSNSSFSSCPQYDRSIQYRGFYVGFAIPRAKCRLWILFPSTRMLSSRNHPSSQSVWHDLDLVLSYVLKRKGILPHVVHKRIIS